MRHKHLLALLLAITLTVTPFASFAAELSGTGDPNAPAVASEQEEPVAPADEAVEEATGDTETVTEGEAPIQPETDAKEEAPVEKSKSATSDEWVASDFTYGDYEELIYGCDYTRQITVSGKVVTGFSAQGEEKLANKKDLVLPAKDEDGTTLVGVGASAFKNKGLTSVKFPTGMMVSYDDTVTNRITKRGNYVIDNSAFAGNELTSVYLPSGVLAVMPSAFQSNKITKVTLPRTIWWVETLAFAKNKISNVSFPVTTDFQFEMHGMAFAENNIKSVTLPDYTEVVNKYVFAYNPGMEACDPAAGDKEVAAGGVVYMYTDNPALFDKDRIHHLDKPTASQKAWHQKLILVDGSPETTNPDTERWSEKDFTFDGQTVTGLSESGKAKRATNKDLVIPDYTPDGFQVTALADTTATYGLFATETEKFDSVRLPSGLQKIGNNAFRNSGLADVVFPDNLKEIGMSAFLMNNLSSVILPDTVNKLGSGAFATNPKLERINLSKSLTEIPTAAFGCSDNRNYMTNLRELEIPDSIVKIGDNAFAGNNIKDINIPSSVKSIGKYAFSTKNYLRDPATLTLPEGLETIGNYAFRNKIIETVKLPESVQKLDANVFLKEYSDDFPVAVTKVYVSNFEQYSDKTNFPVSDTHKLLYTGTSEWVAEDFTYGTRTLKSDDYVTVGNDKDAGLTGDIHVITGLTEQGENKLALNKEMVIPSKDPDGKKIQGISDNAFKNKGLTSLTLPETEKVDNNTTWDSSVAKRGDFFIMGYAFSGNKIETLDVPEGVLFIGTQAFRNNKLTSVKLPSSLMVVSSQAFNSNTSGTTNAIASLDLPKTTDFPITIGTMAFGFNKITAIQLPAKTAVVDRWAFIANPGKEPVPPGATVAEQKGGVVYMYIEDEHPSSSIGHLDGIDKYKSNVQKLFAGQNMSAEDSPWNANDFTYDEGIVTGLSETGQKKIMHNSNIVIPEKSPDGVVITEIGSVPVAGNHGLFDYKFTDTETNVETTYVPTSVIFPSTLKKIGSLAFQAQIDGSGNQTGLTSVTLPSGLEEIGQMAFRYAPLSSVRIPDSVTKLGNATFITGAKAKTKIEELTLSAGLTEIPASAFMEQDIKELVLPSDITSVGERAFAGSPLTSLVLNDKLTTINSYAFLQHQLKSLVIPASVKTIGSSAFSVYQEGRKHTLEELVLSEGLVSIASKAFDGSILKTVTLPTTVTTLNKAAFNANASGEGDGRAVLKTSSLEQSTAAGIYTKVVVDGVGHVVEYDDMAGTGWDQNDFTYSADGMTITGWSASGNEKRKVNHDLVLPNKSPGGVTITTIGASAFQSPESERVIGKYDATSKYGIETVVLPEGLQVIDSNAFEYNNLKAVPLESASNLKDIRTSAFHGNQISKLVIPDTVNAMGSGAFSMNAITDLTMSKNVTVIPSGAFSMNIRLDHIKIPDTVTEIQEMAFAGARLTKLDIPASVEKVGRKAFHLHHLESLTVPGTLKDIGDNAFEGTFKATTLLSLTLEEGIEKIGSGAFKEGLLEEVALPMSLTYLGNEPFQNNTGKSGSGVVLLTTENPEHMKWNDAQFHMIKLIGVEWAAEDFIIEDGVVKGLSDKGKVKVAKNPNMVIPSKDADGKPITSIAQTAFNGVMTPECAKVTSVVIPDSVTSIGKGAFTRCTSLADVTLSKNLKEIPDAAFNTTAIKNLEIPKGVKSIGNNAFTGSPIEKLKLPSTLESIGTSAFANHQLKELEIPASVKKIGNYAFRVTQESLENTLTSLKLNEGLESIGSAAFGRSNLTSVDLPSTVKTLNKLAFDKSNQTVDVHTENVDLLASDNPTRQLNIVLPTRKVTFKTSYGTLDKAKDKTNDKGVLAELKDPSGADTCNTFEGWFMSDGTKASVDTVYSKDTTLTAKWTVSHDWSDWTIVEPTVDSEGSESRVCNKNPDHVETKVIPKISYKVTEGNAQSGDKKKWTLGDQGGLEFRVERNYKDEETFEKFADVAVDGVILSEELYTAEAGSVILNIKDAYLNTLAEGNHELTVSFNDNGSVSTTFSVADKNAGGSDEENGGSGNGNSNGSDAGSSSVKTGDETHMVLYMSLILLAAMGIGVTVIARRRKN